MVVNQLYPHRDLLVKAPRQQRHDLRALARTALTVRLPLNVSARSRMARRPYPPAALTRVTGSKPRP